ADAWYVARKDLDTNTLLIVQGHDHPWLQQSRLSAQDISWVAGDFPSPGSYGAKTRYRQADAPCQLAADGENGFSLNFDVPQWAVTPGQSAVVYDGEICLGGGIIVS